MIVGITGTDRTRTGYGASTGLWPTPGDHPDRPYEMVSRVGTTDPEVFGRVH